MKRYDLFQKDEFDGTFFPYYERTGGYTKKEADALVTRMKKAGTKLTMRVHKEAK